MWHPGGRLLSAEATILPSDASAPAQSRTITTAKQDTALEVQAPTSTSHILFFFVVVDFY